ncbi:isochorismatase family cysteine hydrolase [Humibacillus xanthopallidus]|uniref:Ureidoacrylate peracid hydrolase n=1 Tax=Humibacillus xanthopallidus TaxID=412689 RepID=A0A543H8D2_9MICO|nr:isochorismatase family cysteine hydrolase [Humibacillus xanthopallidus]TQM54604.1 ureidoacrylate peracid hydrolase [Humibacillus xanthopallidus]
MMQFEVAPHRMALINVDIQNVFVEMAANSLEVVGRINRLAAACRSLGMPVIHVRHAHPAGADTGLLGELFPSVRDGMLERTSQTAAFHESLIIERKDQRLEKPHFGAFHDTDLLERLEQLGADTIIITGIETNVCCETTAREAMVRDVRAFFISDATTTGGVPGLSVEAVQRASLATVGALFAQVTTTDQMIEWLLEANAATA